MTVAPLSHSSQRRLRGGDESEDIQLEHLPPAAEVGFSHRLQIHHASVIDEDVNASEAALCLAYSELRLRFSGEIGFDCKRFTAYLPDLRRKRLQPVLAPRCHRNLRARLCEYERRRFPNT